MYYDYGQRVIVTSLASPHSGHEGWVVTAGQGFLDEETLSHTVEVAFPTLRQVARIAQEDMQPVTAERWPPDNAFATMKMRTKLQRWDDGSLVYTQEGTPQGL